jgi:molybdopterin converting factor small subunit
MAVKVIFYPPYCDWLGYKSADVELPADQVSVEKFIALLLHNFPQLNKKSIASNQGDLVPPLLIMIDSNALQKNDAIKSGDEIKILYPLCGG